jgi:quinol monooxygenase YgiN
MIRHIVFFTLKAEADAEAVMADLRRLGMIPGALRFEVSRNLKADQIGNAIDVVVYGEFEDVEALHAYKRHPTYADVTSRVRPLRELRHAADVEIAGRSGER